MALGMVSGRFQFQRATKEEWENSDIVLLDGEIAIESDTTKMKAGDGKTIYKDLLYITIGEMSFKDLTEEEKAKVKGEKGDPFTYDDFTKEQLEGLKGEKAIKISSTEPEDKEILWVKDNNVRHLYETIVFTPGSVLYYGNIANTVGLDDAANFNACIFNMSIGSKEDAVIFVNDKVIKILEFEKHPYEEITLLEISDDDLDYLKKSNLNYEYDMDGDLGTIYLNYPGYSKADFKLGIHQGEEIYSTLNIYDYQKQKWMPVIKDGEKGEKGDSLKFEDLTEEQKAEIKGKGFVDANSGKETKFWLGTSQEYEGITNKDPDTLYMIKE